MINRFDGEGILIGAGKSGVRVEGDFIGTDPSGTLDRGNSKDGVLIYRGDNNTVGGASPEARNLVSGNDGSGGVHISGGSGNRVQNNYIGTRRGGVGALGNRYYGVPIGFSSENIVGGTTAAANTVAFNKRDGVQLSGGTVGDRFLSNSIFSNGALGIDLLRGKDSDDGPTPNDPGDADTGANGLQNFPVVTSAVTSGNETTIRARLNTTPTKALVVRFFSNPATGDEGKSFIGQRSATTGADGKVSFTFEPAKEVTAGRTITATATDPQGNTSEFSAPHEVA